MGWPQRQWPYLDQKGPAPCRREDKLGKGSSARPSWGLSLLSGEIDVAGGASCECQQDEDEGSRDEDDESGVVQVGAFVHRCIPERVSEGCDMMPTRCNRYPGRGIAKP